MNLRATDLSGSINKSVRTSVLPLSHHGSCAMITVGHLAMEDDRIVANIMALGQKLAQRYPGGWKNIRSIHLKSEKSLAIPVHISTRKFQCCMSINHSIHEGFHFSLGQ